MPHDRRPTAWAGGLAVAALATLAGCATLGGPDVRGTERLLSAAGFEQRPADTPERRAQLATLPPHKLIGQPRDGTLAYVYADPTPCGCLYAGDQKAYQAYQKLLTEQRIADWRATTAAMDQDTALDWDTWGPFGWWGAPVVEDQQVVVRDRPLVVEPPPPVGEDHRRNGR
jgi:hypothetical protein